MPILVVSRSPGKMQMSIAWKLMAPGYHHFTRKVTFISNILYCFVCLFTYTHTMRAMTVMLRIDYCDDRPVY